MSINPKKEQKDVDDANDANETKTQSQGFPSGQLKLLSKELTDSLVKSTLKIKQISTHQVEKLENFVDVEYHENKFMRTKSGKILNLENTRNYIGKDEMILVDISRKPNGREDGIGFLRAGCRKEIVYKPSEVKAVVVTCGGLCPGLNDVLDEIVRTLYYSYGVDEIYGIPAGYRGFYEKGFKWIPLTPDKIEGIHFKGGSYLVSSRGGFNGEKIIQACVDQKVTHIYIVGGDGTHRGAEALCKIVKEKKLKISICGIPKTVDNDIGSIDRSFGFQTAVEQARKAIISAKTEAECNLNSIGIVKLMGRHAGFIASHAVLASKDVDLCLIPEINFTIDKIGEHIVSVFKSTGHAVIVLAEGAGLNLMKMDEKQIDESGNIRLQNIDAGRFLCTQIKEYFTKKEIEVSIKYHDPTYMIRSVSANAADSVYCSILSQNAVHGMMAGYTEFTSALVNNRTVYVPIKVITSTSPTTLNVHGRTWERVLGLTQQPQKLD